ncbi:hypothetical protein ACFR9U_15775 [Halorientalis brevis]|uniref:DUF7979 domain-containing protein n=1 Tax=Halorientalis brevis TaxID=1126241 RepID=A0ABD6CER5_9EURY|nr:hypothetical protein [Halorientalis brevis]
MGTDRNWGFVAGGLFFLLIAVAGWQQGGATTYVHTLQSEGDTTFNETREGHIRYTSLSAHGQRVVANTIERGEYVVDTEDETVSHFDYPTDTSDLGSGWYVIHRGESNYTLMTHKQNDGVTDFLSIVVLAATASVGLLLCYLGIAPL